MLHFVCIQMCCYLISTARIMLTFHCILLCYCLCSERKMLNFDHICCTNYISLYAGTCLNFIHGFRSSGKPVLPELNYIVKKYSLTQGVPNNDPTCFCQNFIKSLPKLIIFWLTDSQGDRIM